MNSPEIINRIKEDFLNTQGSRTRAGIEISVRCPFCGDSDNLDHSHLYIGFDLSEEKPHLPYHCKKCSTYGGNVNYELYQKITDKNDEDIRIFLNKLNKGGRLLKKALVTSDIVKPDWILQDTVGENKSDLEKANYFFRRTGIRLNQKTIKQYKVILNLKNFLNTNNIKRSALDEKFRYIVSSLSENYIGFLSYYNNYIYLRHKLYKPPPNHLKHHRLKLEGYKGKFLYIPSNFKLNLMSEKPKLALTEGVFDLINVQKRFYTKEQSDVIYAASGSKASFNSTINEVISITGFINLDVTLYADADIKLDTIKRDMFGPLMDNYKARIIYHKGLKDFGNIEEGENKILKYDV